LWASHLSISAIVFPEPNSSSFANYARCLNHALLQTSYPLFYLRIKLKPQNISDLKNSSWLTWNAIRSLCEYNTRLSPALEIDDDLPDDEIINQWFSEPVKLIFIPSRIFLSNSKGYPVLSKKHQAFVRRFLTTSAQFVVTGDPKKLIHEQGGFAAYQTYIRYLHRTQPEDDPSEQFAKGYQE